MSPVDPHRGNRPARLEEVAERAGVSRATASRVLRGQDNVSDAARAAVLAAADDIAYTPNLAARTLVTGRSDSLAFLVQETEERLFSDPFFPGLLRGAQRTAADAGMQLVFTVASLDQEQERFIRYASAGHVDGVLLVSLHGQPTLPRRLEDAGVPVVLLGRPVTEAGELRYVDSDNVGGGRLATEHLLRSGRRRVATITGPQNMGAGQDRLAGYAAALDAVGVAVDPDLVETAEFTAESGERAMARLLERRPDLDAVFVASDLAAFGAIRTLRSAGRDVPGDVAVVGFDDIPQTAQHFPPLTTVRQPITDLSVTMTRLLLARIAGESTPTSTVLPVELVHRQTA